MAFFAFRIVDLGLFSTVAARDGLPLWDLLLSWDGGWYHRAHSDGWPEVVNRSANGTLEQSTWAWPPLYPLLGRLLTTTTGLPVGAVLVGINLASGAIAAVILHLSLRPSLGVRASVAAAVAWAAMPAAPVLLMAYAEGLFALIAFAAMWAAIKQRLVFSGLLLIAAGLTKASVLPFAIALVLVAISSVRNHEVQPRRPWSTVGAMALALGAIVVWPLVVAVALGSADAYGQVQAAWGRSTLPGYDTTVAVVNLVRNPTIDTVAGLGMTALAVIAGILVWRDRQVPLFVRLVGLASPVFLIATGAALSSVRLLLPDPAMPVALRRIMTGAGALTLVLLVLTLARWSWIAVFVSGVSGDPPP